MPLALAMALLGNPQLRAALGRGFAGVRGLFGGLGRGPAAEPAFPTPERFGGRAFTGVTPGVSGPQTFGHFAGAGGVPTFNLPGAGGGAVMIPELARAAASGDAFARGAVGRQAESAGRFAGIDQLLELLREQAREAGMPDPFAGPAAPASVGGAGLY